MVELGLQAEVTQTLELLLAPRLLQMLKILSLPYLEAVEQLNKEAEENPVLDVERQDEYLEFLRYLSSDRKIKKEADFDEFPGLENIGRVEQTLEESLLQQLELEDLEDSYKEIAREIIGGIDDHGYLLGYPQLRAQIMEKYSVSRPTVDKVLKLVQGFEPEGVGARDLKECLLLQITAYDFDSEELAELLHKAVENYLEDIESKNLKNLAAGLKITEHGAEEIVNFIKNNLNPYPGAAYGGGAKQVIPSFAIEGKQNKYKIVNLETRYGPVVKLSPQYLKMYEDPKTDEKTKTFLKSKIKRAKEMIEDFSKRGETLEKVVRKIIDSQQDFLDKGALWLKPLSQRSLASEFGLHPSTISRAVAGKYVQTPQGLFSLKFLCPRGPKGMTAARHKAMIFEITTREDKFNPLTDEQIMNIMKEQGAKIDRRTIAYYRLELKIPAASGRQKHG